MNYTLIDGKSFAEKLVMKVADAVNVLNTKHHIKPGLAVVLVGQNPASEVYVKNKVRQTKNSGMNSIEHRLPDTTSESDLLSLVNKLNEDEKSMIIDLHYSYIDQNYLEGLKKQNILSFEDVSNYNKKKLSQQDLINFLQIY